MPSWKELKRFCDRDGWDLYKDTDHYFYRKYDELGNLKRTKVSKGSGEVPSKLWNEILKKQLQVDMAYFNKMIYNFLYFIKYVGAHNKLMIDTNIV